MLGFGCSGRGDGASSSADSIDSLDTIVNIIPDTLRVATLYSPSSYFIYREQQMGYDYELASRFAADKGVDIDIVVAHNLAQAVEMLDSGLVHLIAYEVPVTAEYLERYGKYYPSGACAAESGRQCAYNRCDAIGRTRGVCGEGFALLLPNGQPQYGARRRYHNQACCQGYACGRGFARYGGRRHHTAHCG